MSEHRLNEHGTTFCPTEHVAAFADREGDDLICSACGAVVEKPSP